MVPALLNDRVAFSVVANWVPSWTHLNEVGLPPVEAFVKFTLAGMTTVMSLGAETPDAAPSWIMLNPAVGAAAGILGMTVNWFSFCELPFELETESRTQKLPAVGKDMGTFSVLKVRPSLKIHEVVVGPFVEVLLNQTLSPPAMMSKPAQAPPLPTEALLLNVKSATGTWVAPTTMVTKADAEPALVDVVNCTRYEPGVE